MNTEIIKCNIQVFHSKNKFYFGKTQQQYLHLSKFLIDNYRLLFVDGDFRDGKQIINKCKYNAYGQYYSNTSYYLTYHKTFYDPGYDEYVEDRFPSGELPEYEGVYRLVYQNFLDKREKDRFKRHLGDW